MKVRRCVVFSFFSLSLFSCLVRLAHCLEEKGEEDCRSNVVVSLREVYFHR